MGNFTDRFLGIVDTGDGETLNVTDNATTFPVSMSTITQMLNNTYSPEIAYMFNLAARLRLGGFTAIQNPDGSANADSLEYLNSVSFKGYP